MKEEKTRVSYYIPERQAKFIREIADINFRSQSDIIGFAIDCLANTIGGYGDDNRSDNEAV